MKGPYELTGYWDIYECTDCKIVFAIVQEDNDKDVIHCPHCKKETECDGNLWFDV